MRSSRSCSDDGQLTIRLAYNLFTQKPKGEKDDFLNWTRTSKYKQGDDYFRHNGAGEMLVFSAADFEDFRQPRPDMPPEMEGELDAVVRILAENRWPWRLHATYDETISRALDVFERVNQDIPLEGLNWFFDHAETISDAVDRPHRRARRRHRRAAPHGLSGRVFRRALRPRRRRGDAAGRQDAEKGVKISAGTDATRVASYNPWVALAWLVTGRTVGGLQIYPQRNCLDRETALRMWTENVTWFSNEEGKKGRIEVGQLADLIVPDRDYFACAEDEIADTTSDLTIVGGKVVYGAGEFAALDEARRRRRCRTGRRCEPSAAMRRGAIRRAAGKPALHRRLAMSCGCANACTIHGHEHATAWSSKLPVADLKSFWGALGCACWAV